MPTDPLPEADPDGRNIDTRLRVLEMTVAAMAARLPQPDFEEVISMLVFVAKSAEAAGTLEESAAENPFLSDAGRYATEMLDRIAHSRRGERSDGRH